MSFSLNETEALARKAARGAGYAWGIAEEAGRAARWLCAYGQDGFGALAGLLRAGGGCPPDLDQENWSAAAGPLCPLLTGACLSDLSGRCAPLTLQNIRWPALLLPFLAMPNGPPLCLSWPGAEVSLGPAIRLPGPATLTTDLAEKVTLTHGESQSPVAPRHTRAHPSPASLQTLSDFAARTYAPATEASRRLGAGGAD